MIDQYCEICKEGINSDNYVLEIADDKQKIQINGHKDCIDELHIKVKEVKELKKKPVQKVLKEIGFSVD